MTATRSLTAVWLSRYRQSCRTPALRHMLSAWKASGMRSLLADLSALRRATPHLCRRRLRHPLCNKPDMVMSACKCQSSSMWPDFINSVRGSPCMTGGTRLQDKAEIKHARPLHTGHYMVILLVEMARMGQPSQIAAELHTVQPHASAMQGLSHSWQMTAARRPACLNTFLIHILCVDLDRQ